MKQSADEVLDLLGIEDNPTLQVAKELEKQALEDPYFAEKKLFPNVDFYSGIILEAMAEFCADRGYRYCIINDVGHNLKDEADNERTELV